MNHRLQQLRLARGLSLEDLSAAMGGLVTKQALSKYEKGQARPSPPVLNRLAAVLGTNAIHLWSEPAVRVEFPGYRKRASMRAKERATVEALVCQQIEVRHQLQELTTSTAAFALEVHSLPASKLEDAEAAALKLRKTWKLGLDPIANLTDVLEDRLVHVIEVEAPDRFDGISGLAREESGKPCAAAVVSRKGLPGDRQRLNLAHELAHLVLKPKPGADEEALAFRFAGAFLAPGECLKREVGTRRTALRVDELRLLKGRYGISMQAILRRLRDLEIISQTFYTECCIEIRRRGWRKVEPNPIPAERSTWLRKATLRCLAEGLVTHEKAEGLLGEKVEAGPQATLLKRRAFLKLPLEDRRRMLQEQAGQMAAHYEQDQSWKDIQGGDIHE